MKLPQRVDNSLNNDKPPTHIQVQFNEYTRNGGGGGQEKGIAGGVWGGMDNLPNSYRGEAKIDRDLLGGRGKNTEQI